MLHRIKLLIPLIIYWQKDIISHIFIWKGPKWGFSPRPKITTFCGSCYSWVYWDFDQKIIIGLWRSDMRPSPTHHSRPIKRRIPLMCESFGARCRTQIHFGGKRQKWRKITSRTLIRWKKSSPFGRRTLRSCTISSFLILSNGLLSPSIGSPPPRNPTHTLHSTSTSSSSVRTLPKVSPTSLWSPMLHSPWRDQMLSLMPIPTIRSSLRLYFIIIVVQFLQGGLCVPGVWWNSSV